MADAPTTLEILIDIRAKLDVLAKTSAGLHQIGDDAKGASNNTGKLTDLFKQGLGIGTGIELATRAIELFRASVMEAVHGAFELATQVRDGSEALGVSSEAYQVLQLELQKANVDMGRFSMAVSNQTQSLAQVRAGATGAAEAYRELGLNAAQIEALSPEQRVIVVARAVLNATDQTKAFHAASQILGTRGLPQLLSGLRALATDGYDKVAKSAKEAGLVMSDEIAVRLDQAEKNLERFKRQVTIIAGETIGFWEQYRQSLAKNPIGTFFAGQLAPLYWVGLMKRDPLGQMFAKNAAPATPEIGPKSDPAELERQQALREQLKQAQLQLFTVQKASEVADKNTTESDSDRSERKLALLQFEVVWRQRILDLMGQVQQFDEGKSPEEKSAQLVTATADLVSAQNALADSQGKSANFPAERVQMSIDMLDQQIEFAKMANDANLEYAETLHAKLLPMLQEQEEAMRKLSNLQFPDAEQLLKKQQAGTITPAELDRLKQFVALQGQMIGNLKQQTEITSAEQTSKINAALDDFFQENDRDTKLRQTRNDYTRFGNPKLNDNHLTVGQGVEVGAKDWVMSLGTQGEQVSNILQSSLGETVNGISQGIMGWITHAKTFGSAMASLASTVLQGVIQALVQIGVQMLINAVLGTAIRQKESAQNKEAVGENALVAGMKAIAQLGPIYGTIAFIAALAAILALTKGFAEGGYTGDGPKNQRAGFVHAGEIVWSQDNIRAAGGVEAVEALRLGGGVASLDNVPVPAPARARSVASAPSLNASSTLAASVGSGSRVSNQNHYHYFDLAVMSHAMAGDMEAVAHRVFDKRSRT